MSKRAKLNKKELESCIRQTVYAELCFDQSDLDALAKESPEVAAKLQQETEEIISKRLQIAVANQSA